MPRLDRETVQKVLDAADIVEVVSDFVTLKRRGANYMGLCPFHNERTPSFSVSPSKGICKCFSCGKGGSPVNFVMEHEQMTFQEAIRYLAKKYNIPIQERELTPEERQAQSERENMFAVNDFAMRHFEHTLSDTAEGQELGASYLRHRGISQEMARKFRLGFSTERGDLLQHAIDKGYSEEYLIKTGLCVKNEQGRVYDRFRGRVIFPVLTVSGKVVAFGGRTLKTDKAMAKYVNSPESEIYQKRRELYGFYQAKNAIAKKNKCILVEGYLDVVSMHQAGVENVVASSGTSLTQEQIMMIRRFTPNITVIYDSDSAGVKASLRAINMLLAAGMSIKILSLPQGEDPDSFAQNNSSSVVEEYLETHEQDFIKYKTALLVSGTENDPMGRARAISDIVGSIASIPDQIARNVYVQECAAAFGISEKVILNEVVKNRGQRATKTPEQIKKETQTLPQQPVTGSDAVLSNKLRPFEEALAQITLKYAMATLCDDVDPEGNTTPVSVLDFVMSDLEADEVKITSPDIAAAFQAALSIASEQFEPALEREQSKLAQVRAQAFDRGVREIAARGGSVGEIQRQEKELTEKIDNDYAAAIDDFCASFVAKQLCSHPDDAVRRLATNLVIEKHTLSKIHTKLSHIQTERDQLFTLVPRAIYALKLQILNDRISQKLEQLRTNVGDTLVLVKEIKELEELRGSLSELTGGRVIIPSRR